jgi:phage pi2 protein 07
VKFKAKKKSYLQKRKLLEEDIGFNIWNIADHFGLYSGKDTIARELAVYEIMKKIIDIPGHIVEFGSHMGSNLLFMAKCQEILQPNSYKELYCFDSFEGLSTFTDQDGGECKQFKEKYKGNEEILRKLIDLHGFNEWVHIIKGDISLTLDEFIEKNQHIMFSLIYIDVDLYAPTKKILDCCDSLLSKGGVIVFDEAFYELWPGETKALHEFLNKTNSSYQMNTISFAQRPSIYMTKI